jgi:chemotaxis protein methyltransferase CheR
VSTNLLSIGISSAEFQRVSGLLYDLCKIKLVPGKETLVKSRLGKRVRSLALSSIDDYLDYIDRDRTGQELTRLIDSLTTNKTSFFREPQHFDYLRQHILPGLLAAKRKIRIWSAACSSGEEPYSLAILLREEIPNCDRLDVRILATDISTRILAKATKAIYERETVRDLSASILQRHFTCVQTTPTRLYQTKDTLRSMVRFARLNLMDPWPMKGPFDVIFCRNVMIYFDKATQQALVHRLWALLESGGHLFVGHSESLTATSKEFRYVQPATYVK